MQLMIDWRFSRGVEDQTSKFLEGFGEVIPIEWLQYFDERELEMMLCGIQKIDVEDWKANTVLKNYQHTSKQVQGVSKSPGICVTIRPITRKFSTRKFSIR